MDEHKHDKEFFTTFSAVIGFLAAFTLSIMFIANLLHDTPADPAATAQIEERLKPAGTVITDAAALMKVSAPVAARAPMSGAEVVAKVCAACHTSGLLGAPKTGVAADWASRGSLAAQVASAIKGKNSMPARGGDPTLSDDEIKAAVEVLIKGS